ncbi:MAG: AAA family ATPase [Streptosporangiaceae bacterium]
MRARPNARPIAAVVHLDTEEQILTAAKRTVPQLIPAEGARAAAGRTDLSAEQRDAVVRMLTATTATTALIAPAGAGKSHTVAGFARLWTSFTGRRVIGLTTSTNAARVLAHEGLAESYNIAEFLGKIEGSDELRRPVPLHRDDVLVLDEASQLATADLAMVQEAARQAGARIIATGDTAQLGAVEAGGMFRLLAQEVPAAQLHEIRRFDAVWEREASVRLRGGDLAAVAVYDRHGRIRGADQEAAYDRAAAMWLADYLRGKDVLLLAGSNAEAAELSRRVQARLAELGTVGLPQAPLSDGNQVGVGDLVRARLNTEIDAGGQALTNRDTLKVTAFRGPDAEVRRQRPDRTWTEPFRVPRTYLAQSAELAYGGNVHVAQGRTVDTAHLLVTGSLSRQALYVGMTRGRQANTAHVVTGKTAPPGHEPYQQAAAESVLASVLQREADDLAATEQIRQAQEWTGGTGHLLHLWSAATRPTLYPDIDQQITARLTESEAWRYQREHSRQALQQQQLLRAVQLAGNDIGALIDQITAAPMDGARSISSVLHGRLQHATLPDPGHDTTWSQRTPHNAPELAHELAAGLDDRIRELGERMIQRPQPWLLKHLGMLAPDASPALHEDYARRAGIAAGYRETARITDPGQAISAQPHRASPELDAMRLSTMKALAIPENPYATMTRGELEARILDGEHAQAAAPPEVSGQLRITAQAEADAWRQSADATALHDQLAATNARALASQIAAEKTRLEAMNATYEAWSGRTSTARETAAQAKAELGRRCNAQPAQKPPTMARWWRQFEADLAATERAIEREHQTAIAEGRPWPPRNTAQPETAHAEATAVIARLQRDGYLPEPDLDPEVPAPVPAAPDTEEPAPQHEPDDRTARLDTLRARADQAAHRIAADHAEREVRAQYTARLERQAHAQAEPAAERQTEVWDGIEIEL